MLTSLFRPKRNTMLCLLAGLGLGAVALLPTRLLAQETNTQLFLSPTAVPSAIYTPITLSGAGSTTFTASMVPGGTVLNDVAILPDLDPDPSNVVDGSWSSGDLAAINSGNYTSDIEEQPNSSYFASTPSAGSSTVTFNNTGVYFVQLQTDAGNGIFEVDAGGGQMADGGTQANTADRQITGPPNASTGANITIISSGDSADTSATGPLASARAALPSAGSASTVAGIVSACQAAYAANGNQKIELSLVGHGRPGSIKIGNQRINDSSDQNGGLTIAQFQAAIDPYVKSVHFYSCSTGSGAAGTALLNQMAASIQGGTGISAYTGAVYASGNNFYAVATANLVTQLPEPASAVLILTAFPLLLKRRRAA